MIDFQISPPNRRSASYDNASPEHLRWLTDGPRLRGRRSGGPLGATDRRRIVAGTLHKP